MQRLRSHLYRTEKKSQQCFSIFPHRYSLRHPKVSPLSRLISARCHACQLSLQCCVTAILNSNTLLGERERKKKCTTASQVSPISGYVQDSKRTAGTLCHRLSTPNRQSTVNVGLLMPHKKALAEPAACKNEPRFSHTLRHAPKEGWKKKKRKKQAV